MAGSRKGQMVGVRVTDEELAALDEHVSDHLSRAGIVRIVLQDFLGKTKAERDRFLSASLFPGE